MLFLEREGFGHARIVTEEIRRPRSEGGRHRVDDPHLVRPELRDVGAARRQLVRQCVHITGPLFVAHAWPWAVIESLARGRHGAIDVPLVGVSDLHVKLAGRWRDNVDHIIAGRFHPMAADEELARKFEWDIVTVHLAS